jgi:hypothetical protein
LGELLVIERIDAAAEDDAIGFLVDLQRPEIEDATAPENRLCLGCKIREK